MRRWLRRRAAQAREAGQAGGVNYDDGRRNTDWRRIGTNNRLERIMRQIRRRTRVVGAFPDGQSALNLAGRSTIPRPPWTHEC